MKAALFADVSNLYYCTGKKFNGRKVDYQKLMDRANAVAPVLRAFAYGSQAKGETGAASFISCLRKIGFDPKYKEPRLDETDKRPVRKADWEVGIAMDVVKLVGRIDVVILASSNPAFVPLAQWVKDQVHCRFVVLACGISRELRDVADECIEITDDIIEDGRHGTTAA